MPVVVTRSGGPPRVPMERIAKLVSMLAPSLIRERSKQGIDIHDRAMAAYSPGYRERIVGAGESPSVDLTVTGGLLGSVRAVSIDWWMDETGSGFKIVIAPGTGTSAAVSFSDGKAKRTGRRSPTHATLGAIHHYGLGNAPPRPWLALSPKDLASLMRQLLDAGIAIPLRGR